MLHCYVMSSHENLLFLMQIGVSSLAVHGSCCGTVMPAYAWSYLYCFQCMSIFIGCNNLIIFLDKMTTGA